MSIAIHISIPDADVSVVTLRRHMAALGYVQHSHPGEVPEEVLTGEFEEALDAISEDAAARAEMEAPSPTVAAPPADPAPAKRTRRTKAEIEADKAKEVVQTMDQAAVAEERAISTTPEDRKQDEADEQAESQSDTLTLEDVRGLAGKYVQKFGMAAAQVDGVEIFTNALGAVPAGLKDSAGAAVEKWRMTVVPQDEVALRKMVHSWTEALEVNPVTEVNAYNRAAV